MKPSGGVGEGAEEGLEDQEGGARAKRWRMERRVE